MKQLPEFGTRQFDLLIDDVREAAEPQHIDLPYHNAAHAEHTATVATELVQRCLENDVPVKPFIPIAGGWLHDTKYHLPLPQHIRSKELRSSRFAGTVLRQLRVPQPVILGVQSSIRSTERSVRCRSREAVILRRADLDNTTSNYPSFLLNTYRLYREAEQLTGMRPHLASFLLGSVNVLRSYYSEDLSLGGFDAMHEIEKALTNISRLEQETPWSFLKKIGRD